MTYVFTRFAVFLAFFSTAMLFGCASKSSAPVVERGSQPVGALTTAAVVREGEYHVVRKGETLYSIALEHGQSYRDVAAWNAIDNPNMIRIGQQLRVAPADSVAVARPIVVPAEVEARPIGVVSAPALNTDVLKREPRGGKQPYTEQAMTAMQKAEESRTSPPAQGRIESRQDEATAPNDSNWMWPAGGRVIASFVEGGSKGIDIEGRIGESILAADGGKVTYAGSGIRGYGNLIIIQHAGGLSSVYAHNSRLLAKEGQQVTRGQRVAELGDSDADRAKLHFEIRRQGKPLDPVKLLPPR